MSEILLTGLAGSHPLGFLAAAGLLRCCASDLGLGQVRLYWRKEADWFAVLNLGGVDSPERLACYLAERHKKLETRPELEWSNNIKTDAQKFREAARAALERSEPARRDV